MSFEFSQKTRYLFLYNNRCWECGRNTMDARHHILGRVSNSPLNFAPLCNYPCHVGQALGQDWVQSKFLNKTLQYLLFKGYKITEQDKEFIIKNKRLYDEKLIKNII